MKLSPYAAAQLSGWAAYSGLSLSVFALGGDSVGLSAVAAVALLSVLGIALTHAYRWLIKRREWMRQPIGVLALRVVAASGAMAVVFHWAYVFTGRTLLGLRLEFEWTDTNLFTWLMLFFVWNVIYFAYSFFRRYRVEEIKNLRLEAVRSQYELRRLRSQMNPHFIFNAMNTIRALIDENPTAAKAAVTQLSNVLRNSLKTDQQELIALASEMEIVNDYLAIEKARYEERLRVRIDLSDEVLTAKIPPLMLQTLVENAIKHGIAKKPGGGELIIGGEKLPTGVMLFITNPGTYLPSQPAEAIGLENTRQRLQLSFGHSAFIRIENSEPELVKTTLYLPTP